MKCYIQGQNMQFKSLNININNEIKNIKTLLSDELLLYLQFLY